MALRVLLDQVAQAGGVVPVGGMAAAGEGDAAGMGENGEEMVGLLGEYDQIAIAMDE
jgi:hypothetical protein